MATEAPIVIAQRSGDIQALQKILSGATYENWIKSIDKISVTNPQSRHMGQEVLCIETKPYNTLSGILNIQPDDILKFPLILQEETESHTHKYWFSFPEQSSTKG